MGIDSDIHELIDEGNETGNKDIIDSIDRVTDYIAYLEEYNEIIEHDLKKLLIFRHVVVEGMVDKEETIPQRANPYDDYHEARFVKTPAIKELLALGEKKRKAKAKRAKAKKAKNDK